MDTQDNFQQESPWKEVNPYDLFSELLREHSDQVIHMLLYFDGKLEPNKMQQAVMGAITAEPVCNSRLVEMHDMLWWGLRPSARPGDSFSFIEKRLFFFIVLLISGAALAIARYLPTNWNKEFFGMSEIQVVGNSYTVFKFYGEMA